MHCSYEGITLKNPVAKWFTPQEARVIIFVLAALLVGSMVLMIARRLPMIEKDVNVMKESEKEAAQDTTYESPGLQGAQPDTVDEDKALKVPRTNSYQFADTKKPEKPLTEGEINLNTAPKSQLSRLPGVGPKRAEDIIEYREKNGPFKSKKDIQKIKGIGPKTYEKMEKYLSI